MDHMRDGVDARHSRHGASVARMPAWPLGSRRMVAAVAIAAVATVGLGTFGLPGTPEFGTPVASAQEAVSPPNVGQGVIWRDSSGTSHWLGANSAPDGGGLLWCMEFGPIPPNTVAKMGTVSELAASDNRADTDASLKVAPAQMAWVILKHEAENTEVSRAAISVLVHANFDIKADAQAIVAQFVAARPDVYAQAQAFAAEARSQTPQNFKADYMNSDAKRTGNVHGIQAYSAEGKPIAGVPVTVTLNGPAVFDATGTNVWKGVTGTSPITLTWSATGTDKVPYSIVFSGRKTIMVKYGNDGSVQNVLRPGPGAGDPEDKPVTGEFTAHYDFQPIVTSNVAESDSKIVDHDTGVIKDTIHVMADESYALSPQWMYDTETGGLVPIVVEGTAYYTGPRPAAESGTVPEGAKEVGKTTVTATGPGDYTAQIATTLDPDFVTWVWRVKKDQQGKYADYVAADWADHFGLGDETTSVRDDVEVDSTVQSNVTKSGTYLVDNLYIDGFDDDHGDFEGDARTGFTADVDEMEQSLLFFPEGLDVTEANKDKAQVIATVKVPAKNGYVDRVGSNKFKMLDGNPARSYVFVTSFPGDDRTKPFISSVTDPHERVDVDDVPPEIHTTATDKADGDKVLPAYGDVTIQDKVCQVKGKGLKVGETYTLTATAMNKETGEAILDENGKPYTGTAEFTPKSEDDCGLVDVTIPASALRGKTVVMFEDVKLDGVTVALHTDINDNDQTIPGPPVPEVGTTLTDKADGDHQVAPGPVTLVDEVCPKNEDTFKPGDTYTVTGTLMDKATGEPIKDKDGQPVTAKADFTPQKATDCAQVVFKFDTSSLAGSSLVAFETVYEPGSTTDVYAEHKDLTDEGQTVHVSTPPTPLARTGAAVGGALLASTGLIGSGIVLVRRRRAGATA